MHVRLARAPQGAAGLGASCSLRSQGIGANCRGRSPRSPMAHGSQVPLVSPKGSPWRSTSRSGCNAGHSRWLSGSGETHPSGGNPNHELPIQMHIRSVRVNGNGPEPVHRGAACTTPNYAMGRALTRARQVASVVSWARRCFSSFSSPWRDDFGVAGVEVYGPPAYVRARDVAYDPSPMIRMSTSSARRRCVFSAVSTGVRRRAVYRSDRGARTGGRSPRRTTCRITSSSARPLPSLTRGFERLKGASDP